MNGQLWYLFRIALEGSVCLLVVMLAGWMLRKLPKKYFCVLWTVALLRLCCPLVPTGPIPAFWNAMLPSFEKNTVESPLRREPTEAEPVDELPQGSVWQEGGLQEDWTGQGQSQSENREDATPGKEDITAEEAVTEDTRIVRENEPLSGENNPQIGTDRVEAEEVEGSRQSLLGSREEKGLPFGILHVLSWIWAAGAVLFGLYMVGKYIRISGQLREALPVCEFQGIPVKKHSMAGLPAVFGIVHPTIYVPIGFEEGMDSEQSELVLLHEVAHIRRGDTVLKLFSVAILCLHWWNPIVWCGVKLLHRDIEMACDERVMDSLSENKREAYAKALLYFAGDSAGLLTVPAFGESNTESRIKNILQYRKKSIFITIVFVILVGALAVCLGTRPREMGVAGDDTEARVPTENSPEDLGAHPNESGSNPDESGSNPDESGSGSDPNSVPEYAAKVEEYLAGVTAEKLKAVTESVDQREDEEHWFELADRYIILSSLEKEDAVLYGMYGGYAMVLRLGEQVIPVNEEWFSMHGVWPHLFCGDYDHDGEKEYAVKAHHKSGTGASGYDLYVIEWKNGNGGVEALEEAQRLEWLSKIEYEYNEDLRAIRVKKENGWSNWLVIRDLLEAYGEDGEPATFEKLVFGDIEDFYQIDGQWYYFADGGVKLAQAGWIQYEYTMKMACPVYYSETEGFSLGCPQFSPYYYNDKMQQIYPDTPEQVLRVVQADLTHDGYPEDVVVSITCRDGEKSVEELLSERQDECCYVRVYHHDAGSYDPEKWAATGGYNIVAALWESVPLSRAHTANGFVYLARRGGKDYLLSGNAGIWQGCYSSQYRVLFPKEDLLQYFVMDEGEIHLDLNADRVDYVEDSMTPEHIERMVAYTESLDDWLREGQLLVKADIDSESLEIPLLAEQEAKVWEIWKPAEKMINGLAAELDIPPGQTVTGMSNLREALQSLREVRMNWVKKINALY